MEVVGKRLPEKMIVSDSESGEGVSQVGVQGNKHSSRCPEVAVCLPFLSSSEVCSAAGIEETRVVGYEAGERVGTGSCWTWETIAAFSFFLFF